ncbi:large ribosomal subunit protein uL16m-like isoform X2 [Artemia franciscana]
MFDHVELPQQRRLTFLPKVPVYPIGIRPPKMQKRIIEMRGPEIVNTELIHKQYGIVAEQGGRMKWGHYEMLRLGIIRKMDQRRMFAEWRIDAPWKALTKKGQGKRMGGGKGSISEYCHPIRSGRIIIEVAGRCEFEEVKGFLNMLAEKLPFKAKVVNYEMMQKEKEQKQLLEKLNENEYSRKYFIRNNVLGCWDYVSPYEVEWDGRFR